MKNMVALEKCFQCGAYMYLAAKEKRRSFEIILLHVSVHQSGGKRIESRQTRVVASVKKGELVHLGLGNNRFSPLDALENAPSRILSGKSVLRPRGKTVSNGSNDPWRDVSA